MSRDSDLLDDVVARLWRVRERLGPDVYRAAGRAALNAVAAVVLEEAEQRAGLNRPSGVILCFPRGNRREKRGHSR